MFDMSYHTASLEVRHTIKAPRERVFQAWTEPDQLGQWFRVAPDYTTPIAEVDLRVGGRYRLGMQPPDSDQVYVATGEYRLIQSPEKLVFTWSWEGEQAPESLVTVEFRALNSKTEIILTHEKFADVDERDRHGQGWEGCLSQLTTYLGKKEV